MNELIKLSAREAVTLLKKQEVSPLELIDAAEEQIQETNTAINAIPTLCIDRARKNAQRIMKEGPSDLPPHYLYGLPIAVKDLVEVEGVRTTFGSPIYADHVSDHSDYLVERLEHNGAVVIGKSNTPEFGAGSHTFNEVFGHTHNPFDYQELFKAVRILVNHDKVLDRTTLELTIGSGNLAKIYQCHVVQTLDGLKLTLQGIIDKKTSDNKS